MNALRLIAREITGLFVDDERLAVSILAVVGLCAFVAFGLPGQPLLVEALLTFGCLGVLVVSVRQGAARK
ncbi:hypothetical protein SAMN05216304_105116 [Bosea sp. OK403]|uniref:hypothetical protein n=1 Tax=Bosea sp. OK403 TaxID=1855286 RepID=UPI0008E94F3C|nr:hypothetical protein [Bosea sp. OK403]SFJ16413.1 hypothetical protein SAMN05216304_105116 [Bosea sp. OK403]